MRDTSHEVGQPKYHQFLNSNHTIMANFNTPITPLLLLAVTKVYIRADSSTDWNSCLSNSWVPYRDRGKPKVGASFYACKYQNILKPGWNSSHESCRLKDASLAWWTHWRDLIFYYDAFQEFKQTLNSATYFMVFLNLRTETFPNTTSYYQTYNPKTRKNKIKKWNNEGVTMIRIQHKWYTRTQQDLNCVAFRMEKDNFIDSDIDFVPCDETAYSKGDRTNDMEHFLCRKPRSKCPTVTSSVVGDNVIKIEGIYAYYYGTMRKRHQQPSSKFLANATNCHFGCEGETMPPSEVEYFSGDWLRYQCTVGYRTQPDIDNHKGSYAVCGEDGTWQYKLCQRLSCDNSNCQNGGEPYLINGACECDCPKPYGGESCTKDIYTGEDSQVCNDRSLCRNGGTCIPDSSKPNGYRCSCKGAVGDNCEYELNECSSNPCAASSQCIDLHDGYQCLCDSTTEGIHCTEAIPVCKIQKLKNLELCKNEADCYSCNTETFRGWCEQENKTEKEFLCNCKKGYTGSYCENKIQRKADAWQIFAIVLGCMLFVIISLFCEIIGSRRRHDHDNLQVLLESIDGYLRQRRDIDPYKRQSNRYETEYSDDSSRARMRGRGRGRARGRGWRGRGRGGQGRTTIGGMLMSAMQGSPPHKELSGTWSTTSRSG